MLGLGYGLHFFQGHGMEVFWRGFEKRAEEGSSRMSRAATQGLASGLGATGGALLGDLLFKKLFPKSRPSIKRRDLLIAAGVGGAAFGAGRELLRGGKADGIPDKAFNQGELEKGVRHEREHTSSAHLAREIAKDHLAEHPLYYSELSRAERKMT